MNSIACDLRLARTSLFAKLTAILLASARYTNAGHAGALRSLGGHHDPFDFEFLCRLSQTARQSQHQHDKQYQP
jgi:hypothetical protein